MGPVRGLRLVVTAEDYDEAVRFHRNVLGMQEQLSRVTDDGRVTVLEVGVATLEIADPRHTAHVDSLEVGRRGVSKVRVALEVPDAAATAATAAANGVTGVGPVVRTPWGSFDVRLDAPAGVELTLYSRVHLSAPTVVGGQIHLAAADPLWAETGSLLTEGVRSALGAAARLVEHVGSTAVPGLPAKPVIDLVLAVPDPTEESAYVPALEALGYRLHAREPDWHDHRLLKLTDPSVNLHVFALGSTEIERMLDFRDHLREDHRDRNYYARTKQELGSRTWAVVQDYADAKTEVVREILGRATDRQNGPARPTTGRAAVFVLVSGLPGSGKTTLARALAPALGLPLIAKDTVKEALVGEIPVPDVETARRLGRAAAAAVIALAAESAGAVLEGPWHRSRKSALDGLPGPVVEVCCRVDRQTAMGRYGSAGVTEVVAGGWPVLEVDTTSSVDVHRVARQVRQLVHRA